MIKNADNSRIGMNTYIFGLMSSFRISLARIVTQMILSDDNAEKSPIGINSINNGRIQRHSTPIMLLITRYFNYFVPEIMKSECNLFIKI